MLNSELHLSHKVFDTSPQEEALRDGYGKGLLEMGSEKNVVVLSADLEESTRTHWFAKMYPDRFFEVGVAEQNMATIAAGLGISGKIPFINSYATFSPGRNWEQIRTTIAYNDSNVKIAGHHAGISVGPDGATHQSIEDIATMRAMPNMKVIVPADAYEAQKAVGAMVRMWGPMYIRLAREKTPLITTKETSFTIGKAYPVWISKRKNLDVCIIAAGPLLHNALIAARELEKEEKIGSVVINSHTIKPLDIKTISTWVKKTGAVVTVEEHSVIGGLGSAVSGLLGTTQPAPIELVGVQDIFGQSGTVHELWCAYHLDVNSIKHAAQKAIKRKK